MFCMKCGKEVPDGAKFCVNCGVQLVNNKENGFVKKRKLLSDRTLKIQNRTNSSIEDTEIEKFMYEENDGDVLSPKEIERAIFHTKFDNEEDLADLIYRYGSYWDEEDFKEAKDIFSEDEGYHAAMGLLYWNGKSEVLGKNMEKAVMHLKEAISIPTSMSMLLSIYGQINDFENLAHYVDKGIEMDIAAAFFFKGMLCLRGNRKDLKSAKMYVQKSVEKSNGMEREAYLEILNDM